MSQARLVAGFALVVLGLVPVTYGGTLIALDAADAYQQTARDYLAPAAVVTVGGAAVAAGVVIARGARPAAVTGPAATWALRVMGLALAVTGAAGGVLLVVVCGFGCSTGELVTWLTLSAAVTGGGLVLASGAVTRARA